MTLNDHDWILIHYNTEEALFLEPEENQHFIQSGKAMLERSAHIVHTAFSKTGFCILFYIEQAQKIVGRDWKSKTNLYISIENLFQQWIAHYNTTADCLIDVAQIKIVPILKNNWLLGTSSEEKDRVADTIIYMNHVQAKSSIPNLDSKLQISKEYIASRNQEEPIKKYKEYIISNSHPFI